MFGKLFGGGRFLDEDLEDWQLETWAWLMRHLGGMAHLAGTPLVLPTKDFFPPSGAEGHDKAAVGRRSAGPDGPSVRKTGAHG